MKRCVCLMACLAALSAWPGASNAMDVAAMEKSQLQVKLTLQTLYTTAKTTPDTISAKKARVSFEGSVPTWTDLKYKLMLDGVQTPSLIDMYMEYSRKLVPDLLQAKARGGQMLVPFSVESLIGDFDIETINKSVVVESLVPGRDVRGTCGRDVGGSLEITATPWLRENFFVGTVSAFNGEGAGTADKNSQKDFNARAVLNPFSFVSMGGSYASGRLGSPRAVKDRVGVEGVLRYGPALARSEYIYGKDAATRKSGYYVFGSLYLWKTMLQAVGRYEEYDPNRRVSGDRRKLTTLGLNYYPTKEVRVSANYVMERDRVFDNQFMASVWFYF